MDFTQLLAKVNDIEAELANLTARHKKSTGKGESNGFEQKF